MCEEALMTCLTFKWKGKDSMTLATNENEDVLVSMWMRFPEVLANLVSVCVCDWKDNTFLFLVGLVQQIHVVTPQGARWSAFVPFLRDMKSTVVVLVVAFTLFCVSEQTVFHFIFWATAHNWFSFGKISQHITDKFCKKSKHWRNNFGSIYSILILL